MQQRLVTGLRHWATARPSIALTHEMLGADARERLFLSLGLLAEAIADAPTSVSGRG